MEIPRESMLDIFTQERLSNSLEKAGLRKEQKGLIEKALSVANCSSAVYGAVAYKQGLCDGIKVMPEARQIIQFENLSGKGKQDYGDAV